MSGEVKRRGDTRSDGYRFWSYEWMSPGVRREKWLNPASYERQLENTRIAWRNWKRNQKQATYKQRFSTASTSA